MLKTTLTIATLALAYFMHLSTASAASDSSAAPLPDNPEVSAPCGEAANIPMGCSEAGNSPTGFPGAGYPGDPGLQAHHDGEGTAPPASFVPGDLTSIY